ncbi:N amino acid transport system protein [Trametes pubescens]|uniref:N amino acid transport system protein n=1 Tax=Trametes pubescens TaxID=154538 RepID=A0A1M2VYF7_TRAPU|nr:N amino acid transport system protein [Trametes pubescens]
MSLSAAAAVDSKTETTTESGPISVHLQNTEKGAAEDVFGDEDDHDIRYKTLSWPFVAAFMIAEIVSNGMLTLPNAMAVVGIVPSLALTIFLGVFALYTAKLLIDFKLNHPEVHNMGDAGFIIFGPIGREILSAGTVIFAIFAVGSEILSGQLALSTLSNNGLCAMVLLAIFSVATFLLSVPRTLGGLNWLGLLSALFITLCGILAMVGAGANPVPGRVIVATIPTTFYQAFLAITGPVFAYAGHFMFFILISEMRKPEDAMKLVFFRFFRHSRHVYSHTILGWAIWVLLCFAAVAIAFIFATAVPIFSDMTGITASLFASWYTYGIAGFFWLYDTFYLKGGLDALRRRWIGTSLAAATVLAGAFMCVAGTYVSIKVRVPRLLN